MTSVISGHRTSSKQPSLLVVSTGASRLNGYYSGQLALAVALPNASIGYLRVEFPSEFWNFEGVATIVNHSIGRFFVELLPKDNRIEHVYWFSEDDVLKVWTVIPEPDFSLEQPIYEAQMFFMEKFPEYECDFSVIYRFGKSLDDVRPQGAYQIR